jgi:uroporphyrinogen decarboxylase
VEARENWLRAVEFRFPEWIPCAVQCYPCTWQRHRDDLAQLVLDHPRTMPGYRPGGISDYDKMPAGYRCGDQMTDKWGCVHITLQDGFAGQPIVHPLADWGALATYQPPDPLSGTLDEVLEGFGAYMQGKAGPPTWAEVEANIAEQKRQGALVWGNGEKLLDRLYSLRGFENLMLDFAMEPPELPQLIAILEAYELKLVQKYLSLGVDVISFHTDFATQEGLMISPRSFRKWLEPLFSHLFKPCRAAGLHVFLSSDGRTLEVADDLIECGVSLHDPQLRPNTLKGIVQAFKGRLCANVNLDQQGFAFMTPQEIREQVRSVVDAMGMPEGGLMLRAAFSDPNTPLRNIAAMAEAMEEYCFP